MAALIKALPVVGETVLPHAGQGVAVKGTPKAVAVEAPIVPHVPPQAVAAPAPIASPPSENAEAVRTRLAREQSEVLAKLKAEAQKEGYEAGYAEGEAFGKDKYLSAAEAMRKLVESTNAAVGDTIATAEEVVGAIAFEAVCKIVGGQLMTSDGVRAVVAEVVSRARREEVVRIKICAEDMARLKPDCEGEADMAGIPLEVDKGIELGGTIVELKGGHLDGRIETQFRAFAQSIKEAVHRQG
jgi:flagellar assembly protein FliH